MAMCRSRNLLASERKKNSRDAKRRLRAALVTQPLLETCATPLTREITLKWLTTQTLSRGNPIVFNVFNRKN